MSEVSGPVIAIAIILAAVFVPTALIPGITGRLYQQFALTIAISVILSAFNALTLSPALSALLLKPKKRGTGLLQKGYDRFNQVFGRATDRYVGVCRVLIRKSVVSFGCWPVLWSWRFCSGGRFRQLPAGGRSRLHFRGRAIAGCRFPSTHGRHRQAGGRNPEQDTGVKYYSSVVGYSMLSGVANTYSGFLFVALDEWSVRTKPEEKLPAIMARLNGGLRNIPGAIGFAFPPPAIPGIGTAGGVTFILEDRAARI